MNYKIWSKNQFSINWEYISKSKIDLLQLLTKHNSFGASSPNSVGQSNSQLQQQQQQQTHHRAKSSPDPLSMQKVLNSEGMG